MTRVMWEMDHVHLPDWVVDLESFRRWSDDDAFPETGQLSFLQGEVWIDVSKEQLFSHNGIKMAIAFGLMSLLRVERTSRYFGDGAFLSNIEANISNQPDGCFVSAASLKEKRVRVVEGVGRGHVELEGTPDMVLDVVGDSSVEKDTVVLREAYAVARIAEYWLADGRSEPLQFDILRLTRRGYAAGRKRSGWVRSEVFGRWFRLTQQVGADNFPEYMLEAQAEKPS